VSTTGTVAATDKVLVAIGKLDGNITTEKTRAIGIETTNTNAISAEVTRATAAETSLSIANQILPPDYASVSGEIVPGISILNVISNLDGNIKAISVGGGNPIPESLSNDYVMAAGVVAGGDALTTAIAKLDGNIYDLLNTGIVRMINGSIAVGFDALFNNSGINNIGIGGTSLISNSLGTDNIGLGFNSLNANTNGISNIAIGSSALSKNIIGNNNTVIGNNADLGHDMTLGENITAIGADTIAGANNITIIGRYAQASGDGAIAIGLGSGSTGLQSIAIGGTVSGAHTIAIGPSATGSGTQGIALGYNAIVNDIASIAIGKDANSARDNSISMGTGPVCNAVNGIAIGNMSITNSINAISFGNTAWALADSAISIGNNAKTYGSNSMSIGNGATTSNANEIVLGNNAITSLLCNAPLSTLSDARTKTNIQENIPGIEFINLLRPVTYNNDPDGIAKLMKISEENRSKETETMQAKIIKTGFIAQEVEEAAKTAGYDFNGLIAPATEDGYYSLAYSQFVVPLVQTCKQQHVRINSLEETIQKLLDRMSVLEKSA
jgi:hypothetical protein